VIHLDLLFSHWNCNENFPLSVSFLCTINSIGSYPMLKEDQIHKNHAVLTNLPVNKHDSRLCMI
jgi:hypothetical protein